MFGRCRTGISGRKERVSLLTIGFIKYHATTSFQDLKLKQSASLRQSNQVQETISRRLPFREPSEDALARERHLPPDSS